MKPKIRKSTCIWCGLCETYCKEVFKIKEDKSTIVKIKDYLKYKKQIMFSIQDCPTSSIDYE